MTLTEISTALRRIGHRMDAPTSIHTNEADARLVLGLADALDAEHERTEVWEAQLLSVLGGVRECLEKRIERIDEHLT